MITGRVVAAVLFESRIKRATLDLEQARGPAGVRDLRMCTNASLPARTVSTRMRFRCGAVSSRDDLAAVGSWLEGMRDRLLLIDAKVTADRGSWWLEEAGH